MKKFLAFLLSLTMVFAMAAVAFAEGETYLWDNFDDRDPNAKPELAPNGVHLWWDNWANLRAKNEDGALKLDMRPRRMTRKTTTAKTTTTPMPPTGWRTGAKPLTCGVWTASPTANT